MIISAGKKMRRARKDYCKQKKTNPGRFPGLDPGSRFVLAFWIPAPRFHGGKFIPAEAGTGMTDIACGSPVLLKA